MNGVRLRDRDVARGAVAVPGRVARVTLPMICLGLGVLSVWGGLRTFPDGEQTPMGWSLVVLGSGAAVVASFLLVWLNSRPSLSRRNPYSVDAAIDRAREYEQLEEGGADTSGVGTADERRMHPMRWEAGGLMASALLVIAITIIYGAATTGEDAIDVMWIMLTIAGVLVLAAVPLTAVWRPLE